MATDGSEVHRRVDAAWQLYRGVPCADTVRTYACVLARLPNRSRSVFHQTEPQIEERIIGNPNLHPEVAYEWTYGAVYSPKWVKGLTLSADWWHIDMRDIVATSGAQTIILENPPPNNGASTVRERADCIPCCW